MEWQAVKDNLPTTEPGGQVDVYFGSSHWATGIRGMFTYYGEELVEHGELEYVWSEYDQQEDRFYTWDKEMPTHYILLEEIPTGKFTGYCDELSRNIYVGDRLRKISEDAPYQYEVTVKEDDNGHFYGASDNAEDCDYELEKGKGFIKVDPK